MFQNVFIKLLSVHIFHIVACITQIYY